VRRAHPLVFVAMWAVVTLLAVAGFAAFQIGGREAPMASNADLGRQAGALAGLGFNSAEAQVAVVAVAVEARPSDSDLGSDRQPVPVDTLPTHGWLSEMQVRALVSMYFRPEDINRAIRVVWCESRFNPTATNPHTGATGLFQHLPEFWPQRAAAAGFPRAEPTDPEANVASAAEAIYNEGGWDVFACAP
jgi:hypothetical protein